MFEKLKNNKFFSHKRYALIGISFEDIPKYEVLIVEKEKEVLNVVSTFSGLDYDDVKVKVGVDIPLLLNFSGKGIVNKKVNADGNYLKEVLFNVSAQDFFIFDVLQGKHKFVSIVRKQLLTDCFARFKSDNYIVVDYSVGPFISVLLNALVHKDTITSNQVNLSFIDNELQDFQKTTNTEDSFVVLGKDKIYPLQIPLIATLLNHNYPAEFISYDQSVLGDNVSELKLKKMFNSAVVFVGLFFLLSLLISYALLQHYNTKFIGYESQLYNLNHTYNRVKKLEKEREDKKLILQESGVLKQNFLSYYIFKITDSIPDEITLNSLKVNPNVKKIKNLEKIEFSTNTILIQGNSISSFSVNQWVKQLKKEEWVLKIEILDFSKHRTKEREFTLKATIR